MLNLFIESVSSRCFSLDDLIKKSKLKTTLEQLLNSPTPFKNTIELISIHEIRRTRNGQDFSKHYKMYFENIEVKAVKYMIS